jgi:hypothetical protein
VKAMTIAVMIILTSLITWLLLDIILAIYDYNKNQFYMWEDWYTFIVFFPYLIFICPFGMAICTIKKILRNYRKERKYNSKHRKDR